MITSYKNVFCHTQHVLVVVYST